MSSAVARYRQQIDGWPARAQSQREAVAADRARRASRPQTTALPLSAYVGRYAHDGFGTVEITLRDGRIHARNGVLEGVAEVLDGATHAWRVELIPATGGVLQFVVEGGRVTAMTMNGARFERAQSP